MTPQIALLLGLLVVSLVLFAMERIPADVVALGLMLTLILTRLLPSDQAFAGYGSDTVMMLLGLFILTAALVRTGVVDLAGRAIIRQTGDNPNRLLWIIMLASSVLGAFMSNTASTAFFLPIVIGLARRTRTSASQLLMPLAFSSILTSSVTLISTSTNVVINGLMTARNMAPMGMFELAPVGIPIAVAGLIYMYFIGRRMIPNRLGEDEFLESFGSRVYLTEVMILPASPLIGKTLADSGLGSELDLTVLRVVRGKTRYLVHRNTLVLEEADVLLVEGNRDEILKVKDIAGMDIKADVKLSDPELQTEDAQLAEGIIMTGSPLIGRTLKRFRFRERFGLQVLAINRHRETIRRKMSQVPLRMGDVLLVQGRRSNIAFLQANKILSILGEVEGSRPNLARAPISILIFIAVLVVTTLGVLPLPVAVLVGAVVAMLMRCITPEEAYREIEWKALILVGAMLAFGAAMEATGTAEYLAGQLVLLTTGTGPLLLLAVFFVLTVILTQPMSNQAAAVVVVPVALQTAVQLGLNPRTFAMMIAVAASCSYMTPLEPSCLMVYGPGRYRFADFLKVGTLLTVIIFVIAIFLVPLIWPLDAT